MRFGGGTRGSNAAASLARGRGRLRPLIALVVLASAASAPGWSQATTEEGWTQSGGGPEHAGVAALGPGPLDVLASYRFFADPREHTDAGPLHVGLLPTPHGLAGFAHDYGATASFEDDECFVFRIVDARTGTTEQTAEEPCIRGGRAVGYDPVTDALIVCQGNDDEGAVLQARDPVTGEIRWGVGPADLGIITPPRALLDYAESIWHCHQAAVDIEGREVVAPFTATAASPAVDGSENILLGGHRIAAVDLDTGRILWQRTVTPQESGQGEVGYSPHSVTALRNGLLVRGRTLTWMAETPATTSDLPRKETYLSNAHVAWFDRGGNLVGQLNAQNAQPGDATDSKDFGGASRAFAGSGESAVIAIGARLVLVRPNVLALEQAAPLNPAESISLSPDWPAPNRWADHIIIPHRETVSAYRASDLAWQWSWLDLRGASVTETILAPPSDLHILTALNVTAPYPVQEVSLARVDLVTGRTLQRLPIPLDPVFAAPLIVRPEEVLAGGRTETPAWRGHMVPLADGGLLVWSFDGQAALLGTAPRALVPVIAVSDTYPPVGRPVTLDIQPDPGGPTRNVTVAWGDGAVERPSGSPTLTHTYASGGPHVIRVTAILADGRTATAEETVDVGGTPPQELNFLQRAFAPGNLDTTWGIIGIFVVLLGALIAAWRRRRHHSILEDELARLRAIRADAQSDSIAAAEALDAYEARITQALSSRRLNDAQFSVLMLQISDLRRTLRKRALAPLAGLVSPAFRLALDAALEDGKLTEAEAGALRLAMKSERGLTNGGRQKVLRLIEVWKERD